MGRLDWRIHASVCGLAVRLLCLLVNSYIKFVERCQRPRRPPDGGK